MGANERRKPDRPRRSGETGGGLPTKRGHCESSPQGASVDGRRLGSGKPSSLTGGRWKRSWPFEAEVGASRARNERRHWASEVIRQRHSGRQSPDDVGPERPPTQRTPRGVRGVCRERVGRSRKARRQACLGRGSIAARRSGAARENPRGLTASRGSTLRSSRRKPRARNSSVPRVLVPEVGCRGR